MKGGKKSTGLWRGLTSITASLLAIVVGAISIVNANLSFINGQLGTVSYEYVETGTGDEDTTYFDSEFESLSDVVAAKNALAEEISEEGTVLLKNTNDALPLDIGSESVTLWGLNSHNTTLGGMIGSSAVVNDEVGQLSYNLEAALTEKGYNLNQTMIDLYSTEDVSAYGRTSAGHSLQPSFGTMYENPTTYNVGEAPESIYTDDVLSSADDTAAIVVISRDSSEAADYNPNMTGAETDSYERPLALSQNEQAVIELAKAHSTKVIVLINAINTVEIGDLKDDDEIDAIVWAGEPGVNGFLGVADVLSGEVNPSGHIADTYAAYSNSSPAMVNWGVYLYTNNSQSGAADALTTENKGDWYIVESEGIYSGYKYYETRYEDSVLDQGNADSSEGAFASSSWNYADEVVYPFGYGISYTTFSQTLDSVNVEIGGTGTAEVTVTNTGDVAGKSVAQLYVQAPYTEGGLEKAAIQLIGFAKTQVLEPGDSETLTIEFDPEYFASYDEEAVKADGTTGAWVLEAGDYYFAIGNGAHEALNNVLAQKTGSTSGLVSTTDDDEIEADNAILWNLAETDIETYSVGVENQLQDCDINNLIADTVEYTTRSDWTKGWTPVETLTPTEAMLVGLTNSNYQLNANGDGVTWGADNGLTLLDLMERDENGNCIGAVDINDPQWDSLMDQITLDEAIQFIEKGGDDIENIDSIMLMRSYEQDGPLGVAFDQVAGYYVRWTADQSDDPNYVSQSDEMGAYSMATMPTDPVVAATFNVDLARREGELFGEDGLWANISALYAPGVNIHRNPYLARNHEYYSEDSVLTGLMGSAVCIGGESKGIMMEPKHFAFNHQESNRSGISTFFSEQAARENELRGFQMIMSNNYCSGIMTAFNRAGTVYVGAFGNLLTNIARNEWGYTGWYVTDMINGADYMNWRDVTAGGGGNCLTSSAYDTSTIGTMAASRSVIETDTQFQEMMKSNIKYWLYNLAKSNAMNGLSPTTEVRHVQTWFQTALYAVAVVCAVLTVLFVIMGIRQKRKVSQAK